MWQDDPFSSMHDFQEPPQQDIRQSHYTFLSCTLCVIVPAVTVDAALPYVAMEPQSRSMVA